MAYVFPMGLILFVYRNRYKLKKLEENVDDFWWSHLDLNNTPEFLAERFFRLYYSLREIPKGEGIVEFFDLLKKTVGQSSPPRFILPPKLVLDVNYQKVYDELFATPVEWKDIFGAPQIRPAQLELLRGLFAAKRRNKILVAATGIGKTFVIQAYGRGKKCIIVEPQRGMQGQLEPKYNIPIIYGMHHYQCAGFGVPADESDCRVLGKERPCNDLGETCPWYKVRKHISDEIKRGQPVAVNPGNMFQWINDVNTVIIDEFHQVFSQLTNQYQIPEEIGEENGMEWLKAQVAELEESIRSLWQELNTRAKSGESITKQDWAIYNEMAYEVEWKQRFFENYDHVYVYKDESHTFMKLDKIGTIRWLVNKYPSKEFVFVSATPIPMPDADIISTAKNVARKENAPIIYYPVANLSTNSVSVNPDYLDLAASVILDFYHHFTEHGSTQKMIIHSGNTGIHGIGISNFLTDRGISVMKHEKGSLDEAISKFKDGDYQALVVASADAGYDFYGDVFGLQFILKVPYPSLSAEWDVMEKKHGSMYRQDVYAHETITQIVQASGRICRGSDDTGVTIILDDKFNPLFNQFRVKFPDGFIERLYDTSGTLRGIIPSWQLEYYDGGEKTETTRQQAA